MRLAQAGRYAIRVASPWSWSPRGLFSWVRHGWALFESWRVEGGDDGPSRTCHKLLGPFVLVVADR